MKKFLVLGLGLFLVACGQSAMTEEEGVPAVELEEGVMMEEAVMPDATMPAEEGAVPAEEMMEEAAQ